MHRRLHTFTEAPEPGDSRLLERLARQQGSDVAQVAHEAESAALALAVLVRLTAHAGVLCASIMSCTGMDYSAEALNTR